MRVTERKTEKNKKVKGVVKGAIKKTREAVKAGKVDFKIDKQSIIHASVGKASFTADKLKDNVSELIQMVAKLKPASAKGEYIRSITLSTTMSPGVTVDKSTIAGI